MPPSNKVDGASSLPTTAPVLEYICLFTHDLKRKQKRWQDGRLKYHTFNKRIMVYDERGNFIGDMHWREDFDFDEGEEINLERGAVIVQVAECVGCKNQDLTELLDKRTKDAEQRQARSSSTIPPLPPSQPSSLAQQQAGCQFKQRHLTDVFNTPRAPPGRAFIPTTSPYEERIAAAAQFGHEDDNKRPSKRRRGDVSPPSKSGYAQNLFGATLTLSSWSASAPLRSQPLILPIETSRALDRETRPTVSARSPEAPRSPSAAVVDLTDASRITVDESVRVTHKSFSSSKHARGAIENKIRSTSGASEALQKQHWKARDHMITPQAADPSPCDMAEVEAPSSTDFLSLGGADAQFEADARPGAPMRSATSIPLALHEVGAEPACEPDSSLVRVDESLADGAEISMRHLGDSDLRPSPPASPLVNSEIDVFEEPKAKLRIKAKRKRGLLMMNTRSKLKKLTCSGDTLAVKPSPSSQHSANKRYLDTSRVKRNSQGDYGADCSIHEGDTEGLAEGAQLTSVTGGDGAEGVRNDVEYHNAELKKRQGQHVQAEHYREQPVSTLSVGPRLASLGRRSVKSKEIIGAFDNGTSQLHHLNLSFVQSPNKTPTISSDCGNADRRQDESDNGRQAGMKTGTAARLMNPATRGRKAAKLSDASGTVPQSVITTTSGPAVVSSGGGSILDPTTRCSPPGAAVPSKLATELPGFSKVNGGPWSKEAFDLLGYTRPE